MMSQHGNSHSFRLFVARAKYSAWWILTKLGLGIICIGVISEGLRIYVPALGQKLHRMPGLAFLKNYDETYSLDIAPFLAVFFMIAVWHLAEKLLRVWLLAEPLATNGARWDTSREEWLLMVLSAVMLTIDGVLFYSAATQMQWGASKLSLAAFLATFAYLAVLIFVSYVSAKYAVEVDELKELCALEAEEQREIERDAAAEAAFAHANEESRSSTPSIPSQRAVA